MPATSRVVARIPDHVKAAAQKRAAARGHTLSAVIVSAVARYALVDPTPPPARDRVVVTLTPAQARALFAAAVYYLGSFEDPGDRIGYTTGRELNTVDRAAARLTRAMRAAGIRHRRPDRPDNRQDTTP